MFDPYEWKSKVYLHPLNKMNDLYYKVCCYWNAETEMYDSILADGYSYLYDEAYILNPKLRGYSAKYSCFVNTYSFVNVINRLMKSYGSI